MIFKIFFTKPTANIPINNQKQLNSFIHRCLGKDNEYHDKFSDYAISSLQGGKFNNGFLTFNDSFPYIVVSSDNIDFISKFIQGVQFGNEMLFDMKFNNLEVSEYDVNDFYDRIITISPILLRNDNGRKITFDDNDWLNKLNTQCTQKLAKKGIVDTTFKIEFRNKDKAKKKIVLVGDVFNPCSLVGLTVYGKKETRRALYNLGLGCSTGSGFGSVKIYK